MFCWKCLKFIGFFKEQLHSSQIFFEKLLFPIYENQLFLGTVLNFAPREILCARERSCAKVPCSKAVPGHQQVRELTYLNTFFMRLAKGKSSGWQVIGRCLCQGGRLTNLNQSLRSAHNCGTRWRMPLVIYAHTENKRVGLDWALAKLFVWLLKYLGKLWANLAGILGKLVTLHQLLLWQGNNPQPHAPSSLKLYCPGFCTYKKTDKECKSN